MDSRILKVIVAVAALHVLVLGSMFLIQHGCKKGPADTGVAPSGTGASASTFRASAPPPGGVQPLPPTAYSPPTPMTPAPPLPPPSAPTTRVYTIKQGDTLGKIAKLENVTVTDLTAANPKVDPKKLRIGQEIQVPVSGSTPVAHATAPGSAIPPSATTEGTVAPAAPTTYTVRKATTLEKIAKAQGTTVVALKKANRLTSDTIQVGQKLKIPTPAESGQRPAHESVASRASSSSATTMADSSALTHTVQPGETPAIIAKKYGVTSTALLEANGNLNPKRLKVGQKLVIPGKKSETPTPESAIVPVPPAQSPAETNAPDSSGGVSGAAIAPPSSAPAETPAPTPAR